MLPRIFLILAALAFGVSGIAATATDFAGTWTWVLPNHNNQPIDYSLQLTAAGGGPLTGTYYGRAGPQPITKVAIAGDQLGFDVIVNTPNGDVAISYTLTLPGTITIITPPSRASLPPQVETTTATRVSPPGSPQIVSFVAPPPLTAGQSATFSVVAGGNGPFTYQWKKNGVSIVGAASASYTIAAVQLSDAGNYTCTVGNSIGSVTSTGLTLAVSPAPVIPTPPSPVPVAPPTTPAGNPPRVEDAGRTMDVHLGDSIILIAGGLGDPPLSYQWSKNGAPIAGATTGKYIFPYITHTDAGSYAYTVSNSFGSATSGPYVVRIITIAPIITRQPTSLSLIEGQPVNLTIQATGNPDPTFQWYRDGVPLMGANAANLPIPNTTVADSGSYICKISNEAGSITSAAAVLTIHRAARIVNLSSRIAAEPGASSLTAGFVVSSRAPLRTLVRGVGPALAGFGLPAVADPDLNLQSTFGLTDLNDDWRPEHASLFASVGAFPLLATSKDAAVVVDLPHGSYTATVRDKDDRGGALMIEVYDATGAASTGGFVNASTLASLSAGKSIVSGFVIVGHGEMSVLIRAIGPQLAQFGVFGAATATQLELFRGDGTRIATNSGWSLESNSSDIEAATVRAGAFGLVVGANDAAILLNLSEGTYTVETSNRGAARGSVLFELYLVPVP